jgi:hypothetical protein
MATSRFRPAARRVSLAVVLFAASAPGRLGAPLAADGDGSLPLATLLTRIETTWRAHDLPAYLALWAPGEQEGVARERALVSDLFASETCSPQIGRVEPDRSDSSVLLLHTRTFCVQEPSGRLLLARYRLKSGAAGWRIASRETLGGVERFVHIELAPQGFRADGRTLHFEDFELRMERGTIFLPPESVGPTALVFVGKGTVHFVPRPEAEKEQLRRFCGHRELVTRVKTAFVRLNPDDLDQIVDSREWTPDPTAAQRLSTARALLARQGGDVYRLDADLPGSPWWTFPLSGKATVVFNARGTTMAYNVTAQPESLSLFDRTRHRCICMYPASDGTTSYHEDEGSSADLLHHDLRLRLEPDRLGFDGEDALRLRLRVESSNLYLRLAGDLVVRSVTSPRWGKHLFFRAARQNLLVVALSGPTAAGTELTLNVSYSGMLAPARSDDEPTHIAPPEGEAQLEREVGERAPKLYSNDPFWYPQTLFSDYVTGHLVVDLPDEYEAVSGGERVSERVEGARRVVEYRQDTPSRYLGLAVGRLRDAGRLTRGSVTLSGFGMPQTRSEVPELLEQSARILQFFEGLYGPCPYPVLNVIFSEGLTPGGHSPPGMTLISRRALRLKRLSGNDPGDFSDVPGFFLAHELAHQWWGHGVSPANYRERWLSEAQAHYAAALWVKHAQGDKAFRRVLERMTDWALRESDKGPVGLGQRLGHVEGDSRIYRAIVYDKGAAILNMLRLLIGDEAFFGGLRRFQERHRFQLATTDDLRRAWEAVAGRDLSAYFAQWVEDTALPTLRWSRQTAPGPLGWRTTVKVAAERMPGPLPVEIAFELMNGVERRQILLTTEGGTSVLDTNEPPLRVRVNDDKGLLARVKRGR